MMFKKTRLRIFLLIMAIATVIIALMLSFIYIANTNYSYERGISLLESYIENNAGGPPPELELLPDHHDMRPGMKDKHNKMFNLSTFYSVFYNQKGEVIRVNCDGGILYSEQEILEITDNILAKGKTQGVYGKMPYLVKAVDKMTIVALIDNTMETDNSNSLFQNSLLVGVSAWVIILALAWIFSKKIVNPLEQNDQKQKQFISDAGHELKTPISVISANADILSLEIGDNKWLSNIQYENERMGYLVKQLLELVRVENALPTREEVDFSRLVSGGTLPFEGVAFEKGLTINTDIEDGIRVYGNQGQLSQLISILLDNAIHYGADGKEVSVRLFTLKNHAVLSIINSGQPIPDEIKKRLFERFYRTDEARTDDNGHYGLGLAIAKAVVTAHGGKISVNCFDGQIEFRVVISKV